MRIEPLKGFEHEYEICDDGTIYSKLTEIRIRPSIDRHGYLKVSLCKDGVRKTFRVHILTAIQYVPNPDNLPVVDHKDGVKTNPHYRNLEWVTQQENVTRAYALGLNSKATPVVMFDKTYTDELKTFNTLSDASREMKIDKTAISRVCNEERKTAGGYGWRFLNGKHEKEVETENIHKA